jgi:hypothetical protein
VGFQPLGQGDIGRNSPGLHRGCLKNSAPTVSLLPQLIFQTFKSVFETIQLDFWTGSYA